MYKRLQKLTHVDNARNALMEEKKIKQAPFDEASQNDKVIAAQQQEYDYRYSRVRIERANVTFFNVLHLAHVPMSLRARTSALDGWLRIIKVQKGWDIELYDLIGCPG